MTGTGCSRRLGAGLRTSLALVILGLVGVAPGPMAAQGTLPEGARVPFQGRWTTGCFKLGMYGRNGVIVRLHVSALGGLDAEAQMFASPGCDRPTMLARYVGQITRADDEGMVDLLVGRVSLSVSDAETLRLFNAEPELLGCGFGAEAPWQLHELRDVSGRVCGGQAFPVAGSMLEDRFWIDEDGLRFGILPLALQGGQRPEVPGQVRFYKTGLASAGD